MARIVLSRPQPNIEDLFESPIKVLVVDDDEDMCNLVSMLLASEGFEIVGESADGIEAVQMSMAEQPDIVVLDYMMPALDGEEAARFIRATCPDAQIIAFSGAIKTRPDWCDHFLYKGDLSRLPRLIRNLIET